MAAAAGGAAGLVERELGEAIAFAAGFALQRVLEPIATTIGQDIWSSDPIKALDAGTAAAIVSEAVELLQWGRDEAAAHGIDRERFDAILNETYNAPGLTELLTMRRRGTISEDDFTHGLRKAKHAERWDDGLTDLEHERIDLGQIATAIHRGIMRGQGLIIAEPPQTAGKVPHVPESDLDAVDEAKAHGIDRERLRILVGNTGLPPGLMEMLRLLNMGQVTDDDVRRAVAESNLRNEYMDVVLHLRRQLLTANEYQEAALRGIITNEAANRGSALHGMEPEDARILFELKGRPLNVHQITTGLERGGTYGGTYAGVPEPYQDAIRRSNIRPEYAHLAYANRYTLPGAFVLRALAQGGDLTHEETHKLLLESGWPPDLAKTVAARWSEATTTGASKHVTSAETRLVTTLRNAYVSDVATKAQAEPILTELGVSPADQAHMLKLWDHEREITRLNLTPSQIKKAYAETKFTRDEAVARLEHLGMRAQDANTLLDE